MTNNTLEEINKKNMRELSKEELFYGFESFKAETFKYINKLLEVEEKWAFINFLLKKLNSVKNKQELCKEICEGFLNLTNSQVCVCGLFNHDNNMIEVKKISYSDKSFNKKKIINFTEKLEANCHKFLEDSANSDEIFEYFHSVSKKKLIALPIIYSNLFLGYFVLRKEDNNFYKDNVNFINIFPEHIALILENISLYQESEKRNKLKVQFLAGISHEFKTPLNSIIGFAEILRLKNGDERSFKYINNILQSSNHLLTLIQDVLDIAKPRYSSLELNHSEFNTKHEILLVITAFEKMMKEKELDLKYTLMDIKIAADKKRFRQLIYNLISNAVKFNKTKGKINILTYVAENKFFFEITDTGDGISKRNYKKIFEFFSQVNRSQLKRQLGSGIGLALCKMITEAHGGYIDFTSQIKKGSTFWFSLPLIKHKIKEKEKFSLPL